MLEFLHRLSSSWGLNFVAAGLGILGFLVSCYGAYKARGAVVAAELTQETVRTNLQSYRNHVAMTEKINVLRGVRSSILKDKIVITESLMLNARSAAKTLLISNQESFSTETKSAVHSLYQYTNDVLSCLVSKTVLPADVSIKLIDFLDEAITMLEEEDFNREHKKTE